MNDKQCEICGRSNDWDARSCWMCGCAFQPQSTPSGSEQSKLIDAAAELAQKAMGQLAQALQKRS